MKTVKTLKLIVPKYAIVVFLCLGYTVPASAKLGEMVPQLIKRFGNSYTVDPVQIGKKYKFRSENISVDAVVANDISVGETYFSDHPLTGNGEPPNDIVRAILRTNLPRVRWIEIEAARYQADYALRSSDSAYIALLTYSGPQPEDVVWTITVARHENLSYLLPAISSGPGNPLSPAGWVSPPNAQQRIPQKYQPSQQPTSSNVSQGFETIRSNMNRMTSLEWNEYTKSLQGQRISWTGWVSDVKEQWFGGFKVLIDMDPPGSASVQDVYIENLDKSVAAQFRKDQKVRFSGKIKSVIYVLGACAVSLEDASINAD
jgi:hypothetical protein